MRAKLVCMFAVAAVLAFAAATLAKAPAPSAQEPTPPTLPRGNVPGNQDVGQEASRKSEKSLEGWTGDGRVCSR